LTATFRKSNRTFSIFVAVEEEQPFRLDAVQIEIDGELVAACAG